MFCKIQKEQLGDCVELIRRSFATVAREFHITQENAPGYVAFATTEPRLLYQFETEQRPMFGYFDKGQLIGYYSLQKVQEEICEINNLCIDPAWRKNGRGRQLFLHAISQAKQLGFKKMYITIVEENKSLRAWYEGFGAKHLGTHKFDFFPFTCGYLEMEL